MFHRRTFGNRRRFNRRVATTWVRAPAVANLTLAAAGGNVLCVSGVLASATVGEFPPVDQVHTIRGFYTWFNIAGAALTTGGAYSLQLGVYVDDPALPVKDPRLITALDRMTDWMWLGSIDLVAASATGFQLPHLPESMMPLRIKSKRKLPSQQALILSLVAQGPAGTVSVATTSSTLLTSLAR